MLFPGFHTCGQFVQLWDLNLGAFSAMIGLAQHSRYSKASRLGLPWPSSKRSHVLSKCRDAAQWSLLDADEADAHCVDWHADPPAALIATHTRHLLPEHTSVGAKGSQGSGVDVQAHARHPFSTFSETGSLIERGAH